MTSWGMDLRKHIAVQHTTLDQPWRMAQEAIIDTGWPGRELSIHGGNLDEQVEWPPSCYKASQVVL